MNLEEDLLLLIESSGIGDGEPDLAASATRPQGVDGLLNDKIAVFLGGK